MVNINPITKTKEKCIKIHIPKGNALDIRLVKDSLEKADNEIKKYFGINNFNYYCEFWLLSKKVRKCVSDDSNIAKFQELFDMVEMDECTKDILNFVYGVIECSDYNQLKEETSLQRNLKQMLLNNEIIKKEIGKLNYSYVNRHM